MDEEAVDAFMKNYPFTDVIVWCLKCRRKCLVSTSFRRPPDREDPSPIPCDPYAEEPFFKCWRCRNRDQRKFRVDYVGYADKIGINMIPGYLSLREKVGRSTAKEMTDAGLLVKDWLIRYVPDYNSLIEKRSIFEDCLDDRIIEMAKVVVSDELVSLYPGYIASPGGCRLYYKREAGKKRLLARAKGLPVVRVDITDLYEDIGKSETFANLPLLRECVPVIDRAWAAGQMKLTDALKEPGPV